MPAKFGEFRASMIAAGAFTSVPPVKATSKSATATGMLQLELAFRAFKDLAFTTVAAVRHFSFVSLACFVATGK